MKYRAFEKALALAVLAESELHVLSVGERPPRFASTIDEVEDSREAAEEYYGNVGKQLQEQAERVEVTLTTHLEFGPDVETIVEFVKKNQFDLLVIGVVGHSKIFQKLMGTWGSTAQNLARLAPCTLLMVK
jgi:nucleotide-binding universal stress UspA family protein